MLTPPAELPEPALRAALERSWGIRAASVQYRAVGWGSHHWVVSGEDGSQWFVTADELENKRISQAEPLTAGFGRLRAALAAATDLRNCGRTFVVAPVPARDGEPLARVSSRFGVAVYPFVHGQSFGWEEFSSPGHRLAVLDLLAATHGAPAAARQRALTDDFRVPHRDALEAGCQPGDGSILDAYARLTGVTPRPLLLDLYRLRWDIADIAVDVSRFRRPHTGSAEDGKAFGFLSSLVRQASGKGGRGGVGRTGQSGGSATGPSCGSAVRPSTARSSVSAASAAMRAVTALV